MNITHLIYIPFTGLGKFQGFRGQKWYEERAKIFKNYTLKSLANQANRNFVLWLSFRPEELHNPTTREIENEIKAVGLDYVITYEGIAMWDDRGVEHNDDLVPRLGKTIETLKPLIKTDWVYITNFSSDDMFASDVVELIQSKTPAEKRAFYFMNGYVYSVPSDQLADWNRDSSGSQYTVCYPKEVILDAQKWFDYEMDCLKSHEYIPKCYVAEQLPDGKYCCTVHGNNISTGWENKFRGKEYFYDEDKSIILNKFGI